MIDEFDHKEGRCCRLTVQTYTPGGKNAESFDITHKCPGKHLTRRKGTKRWLCSFCLKEQRWRVALE